MRCVILLIKTGRYRDVIEDEIICQCCELNEVENETQFVLYLPLYDDLGQILFKTVPVPDIDMIDTEEGALIGYLLHNIFAFSKYLSKSWDRRRKVT